MTKRNVNAGPSACSLLLSIASACSADVVDLGGGDMIPSVERGARCTDSVIVRDVVRVTNQVELEALRGCEEIEGDLIVELFVGADVSPLASLRTVDGVLGLGAFPLAGPTSDHSQGQNLRAWAEEIIELGYLTSLHGLEAVERIGGLSLNGVGAPDLSAFESLRSVSYSYASISFGAVDIEAAPNLTSLSGLENVRDITTLLLRGNVALQSLAGLVASDSLGAVAIDGSPMLSSLSELSPVSSLVALGLSNVSVRNLDDLQNLNGVIDLTLMNNPALENVDRISALYSLESLSLTRNLALTSVPALTNLGSGLKFVFIDSNPELRSVALGLTPSATAYISRGRPTESSAGFFEITRNPKLETISLADGLEKADYLTVWRNSSLASIDFGSLRSLDTLALQENASLTTIVLGELQSVDSLVVTDNPLLVTAPLSGVLSFDHVLHGNADDAPPAEDAGSAASP